MEQLEQLELNLSEYKLTPARVLMLSQYLLVSPEDGKNWDRKNGYDPNNFHNIQRLQSNKGRLVELVRADGESIFALNEMGDLAIAGSTPPNEMGVAILSGSGLVVARYSKFYGNPSGYTNKTPEQGGYSLDIPKEISTVRALLEHDSFLESIQERNPRKVREALNDLNKKLSTPVLATPFLESCLSITPR